MSIKSVLEAFYIGGKRVVPWGFVPYNWMFRTQFYLAFYTPVILYIPLSIFLVTLGEAFVIGW